MTTQSEKLAAASDPATDPHTLVRLSNTKNPSIRRALAANPNTPAGLLRTLWNEHPHAILENPIFDLWDFTGTPQRQRHRPDEAALIRLYNDLRASESEPPSRFFSEDQLRDIVALCTCNHIPELFTYIPFHKNPAIRLELVSEPQRRRSFEFFEQKAPDTVWCALAADPHPRVREAFANLLRSAPRDRLPDRPAIAAAAFQLAKDPSPQITAHLANCRFLPPELVERFAKSADPSIREALTHSLLAPRAVLEALAADPSEKIRASLAKHGTEPSILELLLHDPSETVRLALAENFALPPALLHRFDPADTPKILTAVYSHHSADADLRVRILSHPRPEAPGILLQSKIRPSPGFFEKIKHLLAPEILAAIPELTGIAPAIIDILSRDRHHTVRLAVAKRLRRRTTTATKTNTEIASRLAKDPHPDVRLAICTDPRLTAAATASLFADPDPRIREKSAISVLWHLSSLRDHHALIHYAEIHRKKSPLLVRLARDPDHSVRHEIARCPEAPPRALGILFDDPSPQIAQTVRNHTRWGYGILLDLCATRSLRLDSVREGATTPNAAALKILAVSRNPFIRHLVARCHRTPASLLEKLAADSHPHIRETASLTLNKRRRK